LIGRYGLSKEDVEISYSAGEIWLLAAAKSSKPENTSSRIEQTRCKECSAELYQMHYQRIKERLLQDRRKYYVDNREQEIYRAKDRSFARYGTDRTWYEELSHLKRMRYLWNLKRQAMVKNSSCRS